MKTILFTAVAALLVGFTAHASLDQYAGNYTGRFNGRLGTLTIGVNGGALAAHYMAANGSTDLYAGQCNSTIGQMLKLKMDGNEVDYATFAFNPGNCALDVQGRELTVEFGHKHGVVTKAAVSVFAHIENSWDPLCFPDPQGYTHCTQQPSSMPIYDQGSFKKQ